MQAAFAEEVGAADRERHHEPLDDDPARADAAHDAVVLPAAGPARADDRGDRPVTTVTAIATTAAAATIVGDRTASGTSAMAIAAARIAPGTAISRPSTMAGTDDLATRGAAAPRERHGRLPPARGEHGDQPQRRDARPARGPGP